MARRHLHRRERRRRTADARTCRRANRHGLIAGATGTGKTVTLQGIAEGFSAHGVPVFVADVKGDLSGHRDGRLARPCKTCRHRSRRARGDRRSTDYAYADNPAIFWDLFGEQGHPIRTTDQRNGAAAARAPDGPQRDAGRRAHHRLPLSPTSEGLLLLDLDDLQAMLAYCAEQCRRADDALRQCHQGQRRHDPAPAAAARQPGRRACSSASRRSRSHDFIERRRQGARHHQHPRRRQADARARSSTRPSCCGCCPSCSRRCPRSAIPTSPSSSSSSTRRICCSTMRPRRCSTRSSRSCG